MRIDDKKPMGPQATPEPEAKPEPQVTPGADTSVTATPAPVVPAAVFETETTPGLLGTPVGAETQQAPVSDEERKQLEGRLAALTRTIDAAPSGEIGKAFNISWAQPESFVSLTSILPTSFVTDTLTSSDATDPARREVQDKRRDALRSMLTGGEAKLAATFLTQFAQPGVQSTVQNLVTVTQPTYIELMHSTFTRKAQKKEGSALQAHEDIEIPGPQIVKLEKAMGGIRFSPDMDIESLVILVMSECSKDSETDLKDVMDQLEVSRKNREAARAERDALRQAKSSIDQREKSLTADLRRNYLERTNLPPTDPRYIDSKAVDFDTFRENQPVRILSGSMTGPKYDARLAPSTNESLFAFTPPAAPGQAGKTDGAPNTGPEGTEGTNEQKAPGSIDKDLRAMQLKYKLSDSDTKTLQALWEACEPKPSKTVSDWLENTSLPFGPGFKKPVLREQDGAVVKDDKTSNEDKLKMFLESVKTGTMPAGVVDPQSSHDPLGSAITTSGNKLYGTGAQLNAGETVALSLFLGIIGTWVAKANMDAGASIDQQFRDNATKMNAAIGAYGSQFMTTQQQAKIDRALKTYYAAVTRLAIAKSSGKEVDKMQAARDSALTALRTAIGEMAPKDDGVENYVSLRLEQARTEEQFMGKHGWGTPGGNRWAYAPEQFFADQFTESWGHADITFGDGGVGLGDREHRAVYGLLGEELTIEFPRQEIAPPWKTDPDVAARVQDLFREPEPEPTPDPKKEENKANEGKQDQKDPSKEPWNIPPRTAQYATLASDEVEASALQKLAADIDAELGRVQDKMDGYGDLKEELSTRLQLYMDRRAKFQSTLTNLLKKMSDTSQSITQNLK